MYEYSYVHILFYCCGRTLWQGVRVLVDERTNGAAQRNATLVLLLSLHVLHQVPQ